MNRLQLVQALRREASSAGGNTTSETPTSTINQTGEYKLLVDYVDDAWNDIQGGFKWDFLWEDTDITIVANTNRTASGGSAQVVPAHRYVQNKGRDAASGTKLQYYPWDVFDDKYPNAQISAGDTPFAWTVAPDKSVRVNVKPATDWLLNVHRYKNPIPMVADSDTPALAAEHHMLIVYAAAMLMYKHDVAGAEYRAAKDSYDTKLMKMNLVETPQWSFGEPLLLS